MKNGECDGWFYVLRILFCAFFLIKATLGAYAVNSEFDLFSGDALNNSLWNYIPNISGSASYNVNGKLNFYVNQSGVNLENSLGGFVYNKILPPNESWTLAIGVRNSASFSSSGGASQLGFYIYEDVDLAKVEPNFLRMGLARDIDYFGNTIFTSGTKETPNWYDPGGIWDYASGVEGSIKYEFDSNSSTLSGYFTNQGSDPINNNYIYKKLFFKQFDTSQISGFKFGMGMNVFDVSVGENEMWLDNFIVIPEPSALSLLAVGLGVVLRRRRRTV